MKKLMFILAVAMLAVSATAQANLLSNPSFESGDLTAWNVSNAGSTVVNNVTASDGVYSVDFPVDTITLLSQIIDGSLLSANTSATLSLDVWSDRLKSGTGGKYMFRLYGDSDGLTGGDLKGDTMIYDSTGQYDGESQWDSKSADIPDVGDHNHYIVWFSAEAGTSTNYRLDNVSLTPEPATMSLLGLGGLTMMIRKKRGK